MIGFLVLPLSGHSQLQLVSSNTFSTSFGSDTVFNQAKFDFALHGDPFLGDALFDSIHFGTQDVGEVFTVSSEQADPNFNFTVNLLTNGVNNTLAYGLVSASGVGNINGISETQLLAGLSRSGPDLIGYQIQAFSLQIDSLSIQSPGSNPNNNGIWTDMSGQVSFMIYATPVPEPTTSSLLCLFVPFAWRVFRLKPTGIRGGKI
jgi:hypothetical protein